MYYEQCNLNVLKLNDKITQEEYLKNTEELKKKREQIQKELKE